MEISTTLWGADGGGAVGEVAQPAVQSRTASMVTLTNGRRMRYGEKLESATAWQTPGHSA